MVTFSQNLKTWKNANKFDNEFLSERSGIDLVRILSIINNRQAPTQTEVEKLASVFGVSVSTFIKGVNMEQNMCQSVGGNINDSYEGLPEEYIAVIEEFIHYPIGFRKMISPLFCAWIFNKTNLSMREIENLSKISFSSFSKIMRHLYTLGPITLKKTAIALDKNGYIKMSVFFDKLKKICCDYIPTYNLSIAKEKYNFSACKLSRCMGLVDSCVGNLLGLKYAIKGEKLATMANFFEVPVKVFENETMADVNFPLTTSELANKIFSMDKTSKTHIEKLQQNTKQDELASDKNSLGEKSQDLTRLEYSDRVSLNQKHVNSEAPIDKLRKMYERLTPEHKAEINAKIEEYFWMDL